MNNSCPARLTCKKSIYPRQRFFRHGAFAAAVLFPFIVSGHVFNAVAFLFTRVGYYRLVLAPGLILHLFFAYALLMLLRRHQRSVIGFPATRLPKFATFLTLTGSR